METSLEEGDEIAVTLTFERQGEVTVRVPVVSYSDLPDFVWPTA
jgi:copper(I)-binding protein